MIYFLQREDGAIKIGTTIDIHQRLKTLTAETGKLELIALIEGSRDREQELHLQFKHLRIDRREWFYDTSELRAFIESQPHLEMPPKRGITDEQIAFKKSLRAIRKGRNRAASRTDETDLTASLNMKIGPTLKRQIVEYARANDMSDASAVRYILAVMLDNLMPKQQEGAYHD